MRKLTFLNLEPENFSLEAKKKLKKTTKYVERKLNQKELLKEIHKFDILYLRFSVVLDKKVLTKAKNLKFILCNATGIDHIDQVFAEKLDSNNQSEKSAFISKENNSILRVKLGFDSVNN